MARLVGGKLEPPLGTRAWQDTRVEWPTDGRARLLEDAYTGNAIRTEGRRNPEALNVGDLLQVLPLAVFTTNVSRQVGD
jgi:hypothetical protein